MISARNELIYVNGKKTNKRKERSPLKHDEHKTKIKQKYKQYIYQKHNKTYKQTLNLIKHQKVDIQKVLNNANSR